MPIKLYKREGSPCFYARGAHLGVRVFQSLGTGNRPEAERLLAKLQAQIFEQSIRGSVRAAQTFAGAALMYMEKGKERRFMEPLLRHFGDLPIDQIDQRAIDEAAIAIYPNASNDTRNRQVYTPMSAVLKSAGLRFDIQRPGLSAGVTRWITHEEAARLIAACSPHLRPLVMFLLLTGARAGEALWLDWHCVDLANANVSFLNTKNGESRGVPLHRDLVAELASLPHREGEVFRRPDGKPYERPRGDSDRSAGSRIKTAFQGAVKRAGLTNFRVHDCRHTFATWHFAEHRNLIALKELGGWKQISMVQRYAHVNSKTYLESINALPCLGAESVQSKIAGFKVHEKTGT